MGIHQRKVRQRSGNNYGTANYVMRKHGPGKKIAAPDAAWADYAETMQK